MMATTEERVKEVFNQIATINGSVDRDTTVQSMGLDSLDVTELVMEFEEEFDVEIKDDAVQKWRTFGDMIDYIDGQM
jgi:acyl carrier protein